MFKHLNVTMSLCHHVIPFIKRCVKMWARRNNVPTFVYLCTLKGGDKLSPPFLFRQQVVNKGLIVQRNRVSSVSSSQSLLKGRTLQAMDGTGEDRNFDSR